MDRSYIEKIYADLIFKNLKAIDEVPTDIRDNVKSIVAKWKEEQAMREETERALERALAENALINESLYNSKYAKG